MNNDDFFDYVKDHQLDHSDIETRLKSAEIDLDKVKNSYKKMYEKMDNFMNEQRKDFTSFSRWLIGTILITWFLGTCAQLGIVLNVKDKINDLKVKILTMPGNNENETKTNK